MSEVPEAECLDEDIIAAFVDGQLDARVVEAVDAHLATCSECLWLVTAAAVAHDGSVQRHDTAQRHEREQRDEKARRRAEGHHDAETPAEAGAGLGFTRASRWPERFERRQLLAQGGMGAVYYGYDRETDAAVAIKELKPGLALMQPALLGRFIREAEILRRLDHPNIVKMIASVTVGDQQQIVMEYVGGGSLRQLMRLERRLPVARAAAILLELADALSRAHHLGVIHRDIKPENVLLTKNGTPKLGDFGLAMVVDAGLSSSNALLGTIAYLSPEALSGQTLDARADLWALGVMLFEMLTGQRPFDAPVPAALVTAILHQPTPDLEALCPGVPVALVDLVYRLLEKDRNQRIASARQVGAELEAIARAAGDSRSFSETLVGGEGSLAPASAPRSVSRSVSRLPAPTTGFVGRAAELAELMQLLRQRDVRAVTVLGPGGMGKSSLALEIARQLTSGSSASARLDDTRPLLGVFFVDLAPLASAELIVSAVAQAVGFQFKPGGDPKRQLLDYLREKHLLLLMDNFEHVIGGAALVNEILQVAAGVKVLATSRERLGLVAEAQFMLSGMRVPDAWAGGDAGTDSAVQLFIDSARRTRFGFTPSSDDAAAILQICRLVHGMPLGVVLAASWIDTLSLHEIAREILENVDFLRSEAGDLPSRQQSMRAVFEHSWALLGEGERTTLAAVSIFRGGFTRAAAEVVAHASLRTLAALVSKSLLRRMPATGRYEIHELLRQFAEARLGSVGSERVEAMDRLARYYSDFCGERSAHVIGPRRDPVGRELSAELDNVRMALGWMLEQRQAARLWPMLHTLGQFYNARRSRLEGEQLFGSIVSAFDSSTPDADPAARRVLGLALVYQSLFCDQQGRKRAAIELVTRGVAILSEQEPDGDYGIALVMYAWTCAGVGEPRELVAKLEEGIALSRAKPWWLMRALVVSTRVYVGVVGDLAKAEACLRECVALQKRLNRGVIVFPDSLGALGLIRCTQGHRREGCDIILESLRSAERSDDAWAILLGLQFAARAHRDLGDYAAAESFVRRCIEHARDLGSVTTVAWCHLTLGSVLREAGSLDAAIAEYELGAEQSEGDPALLAKAELGLGELALERGDCTKAEQHLRHSLAICDERRLARGAVAVWEALGYLACAQARHDDALECFRRAFDLAREQQKPATLMAAIVAVAHWCARSGRLDRAAELAGLAQDHPATVYPLQMRRLEPLLALLRTGLDATAFEAALGRGRQLSLDRVFAESFP